MLSAIRKFSGSIFAKILLGVIILPFVFWGMGSSFTSGSKNVVVKIDNEKFSTEDLVRFIEFSASLDKKITSDDVEGFLSTYIGNKLVEKEYKKLGIILSDNSLSLLIKNQEEFKRNNLFSRTEYEKFLLNNNMNAASFEKNLANHEKKKQLLNFIGGGIFPPKFIVNNSYNKINQKRNIQLINLEHIFIQDYDFSEKEIKSYYDDNNNKYKEIFKSVKILVINPKMLIEANEYNDLFFKKLDELNDAIGEGKSFNQIINNYNLQGDNTYKINKDGKNINSEIIKNIPKNLIKNIFSLEDSESLAFVEIDDKFFIVELLKTESVQKDIKVKEVRKNIIENLQMKVKRKVMSEIISKINQNAFKKSDFDKLSRDKNVVIQKIFINSINDDKILKKEALNQIYAFSEKQIVVVNDIGLTKNFLVYIDNIENVSINQKPDEYKKYLNLSKVRITNNLFNTYDIYLKKNYKIDINYKALNTVKNYFN